MTQLRAIHLLALVVAISVFKESSSLYLPSLPRVKPFLQLPLSSHLQKLFPQLGPCGKPCCTTTPACENCENQCDATPAPPPAAPPHHGILLPGLVPAASPVAAPVATPVAAPVGRPPAGPVIIAGMGPSSVEGGHGAAPVITSAQLPGVGPRPFGAEQDTIVSVPGVPAYRVDTNRFEKVKLVAACPSNDDRGLPRSRQPQIISIPETDAVLERINFESNRGGDTPSVDQDQLNKAKLDLITEMQRLLKLISSSPSPSPPPPPPSNSEGPLPERTADNRGSGQPVRCGDRIRVQC